MSGSMTAWSCVTPRHGTRRRADGGGSAGGGACAVDADRQAHQCRFSVGGLDPAGQHHDAGAGHRAAAPRAPAPANAPPPSPRPRRHARRRRRQRRPRPRSSPRRNPRAPRRFSLRPPRRHPRPHLRPTTSDASKIRRRALNLAACHFISSSLPSAASPSRNSRAGSPNAWRPPRKRACRFIIFTSPG